MNPFILIVGAAFWIGGWGSLIYFASEEYGMEGVSLVVSLCCIVTLIVALVSSF